MHFHFSDRDASTQLKTRNRAHWSRRVLGLAGLVVLLLTSTPCLAQEQAGEEEDYLLAEDKAEIDKVGPWCNPEGYNCNGTFDELIDHFFTAYNGSVKAWVTDFVKQAIEAGTTCTLESGRFIVIREPGIDKAVLEQLYISKLSGYEMWLRLSSSDGTPSGVCRINYVRTLY